MSLYEAVQAKKRLTENLEGNRVFEPAVLTALGGSVKVSGRPGYSWAREYNEEGSFFQVLNIRVQNKDELPVVVGRSLKPPFEREVVSLLPGVVDMSGYGDDPFMIEHHVSHQWPNGNPGADPVLIYLPAIQPLKATFSGMIATIYGYSYFYQETFTVFAGGTADLTSYRPATANRKKYVLLSLDMSTNTVTVTSGAEVVDTPPITPPKPNLPTSFSIPIAFAILYNGQTEITDYTDARGLLTDANQSSCYNMQCTSLPSGTSLTIPSGQQMIVHNKFTVDGVLTVDGELVIV